MATLARESTGGRPVVRLAVLICGDEGYGMFRAMLSMSRFNGEQKIELKFISVGEGSVVTALRNAGTPVDVLSTKVNHRLPGGTLANAIAHLKRARSFRVAADELARKLRESAVDAVLVRWNPILPLAGRAARLAGIPCMWHMPNEVRPGAMGIPRMFYQYQCWRYGIRPYGNSQFTADSLGKFPVQAERLFWGVDPSEWDPTRSDLIRRADLGIPTEAAVFGIFGRLIFDKGHHVVLESLGRIPLELGKPHLVIVGGPTGTDYEKLLRSIAERSGLTERLHLVGQQSDPARYYGIVDVAINARLGAEAFGFSTVEAMMMGKPVLVHRLGGPGETVIDGVTGWHVDMPSVEMFADGMRRALSDRERWPQMGSAGRAHAVRHFTTAAASSRLAVAVSDLVGS